MKKLKLLSLVFGVCIVFQAWNAKAQSYTVDAGKSELKWTGYHLAKSYEHWGNVKIKSGSLKLDGGKLASGEVVIDMSSITNGDLSDQKDNAKLVNHLKSDDFFNVKEFPEAKITIKSADSSGKITADLTIRGITKEIAFDAKKVSGDQNSVVYTAELNVVRTDFKVMYGWNLENAMLSGEFKMEVKLVAKA